MHINFFLSVFTEFKNHDSIIWKGEKYSYKSLIKNIKKLQSLVEAQQIQKGTVTALIGDYSPNTIALFFVLIETSCIIVPLRNTSKIDENALLEIAMAEKNGNY